MNDTNASAIFAIERPDPSLWKLYLLRSLTFPPFSLIGLPFLYFRYHTMRYRFDDEGIGMSWGILFRREINLNFARIQDIHITSGPLQRWMGLADIHIQTASGSAAAEMTIEGLKNFEVVRNFLYERMRGQKDATKSTALPVGGGAVPMQDASEVAAALREAASELRALRETLTQQGGEA